MDVNAWAVNGNLCGTFIAHFILFGGGIFHKPLQYINYCTILTFPYDFFSECIKPQWLELIGRSFRYNLRRFTRK